MEMTRLILFRPFDLKKWFVIGFCAWLAYLGHSGFNYNYRYGGGRDFIRTPAFQNFVDTVHHTPVWLIVLVITFLALVCIAVAVLFAWLRGRGLFMFTDCVVRNRPAVTEPWNEFRRLGNSYFLFSLLVTVVALVLGALLIAPLAVVAIRNGIHSRHLTDLGAASVLGLIGSACVIFVLAIGWALISHLMIPIMYRHRVLAREGFRGSVDLISRYPGEITIYCLFWVVLGLGIVVVTCVAVCVTCCIAALPYIGTVILLPIYVFQRSFSLLYLRQFGSEYDAWAAVTETAALSPEPPPLPTG